jgi:hypothetical protein
MGGGGLKGYGGRFWCEVVIRDSVDEGCRRDGRCRGIGWTDNGVSGGGVGGDRFGGMVDSISEVGMWRKGAMLDATVDIVLDPCIYLTKGEIHALVVANEFTTEGSVMC